MRWEGASMRTASILVTLALAGCSAGSFPFAPGAPEPASVQPRLYGRPLELVRETRAVMTPGGSASVTARVLRSASLPGVLQVDANDCGPAAVATLLGFYRLQPQGDPDPLRAVKARMPPKQWGTGLEEAADYLNRTGRLWARPYRDGELEGLMAIVQDGRPVPVVVTLEGSLTRMHWLLVVGLARSASGDRYVLCKNPSDADPLAFSAYSEADFRESWENSPLRSQWWSGLIEGVADSRVESYRRPYLDVGSLTPP